MRATARAERGFPSGLKSCIHNFVKATYVSRLSEEERSQSSLTQGFIRDGAGCIVCYTPCNTRENLPAEGRVSRDLFWSQ